MFQHIVNPGNPSNTDKKRIPFNQLSPAIFDIRSISKKETRKLIQHQHQYRTTSFLDNRNKERQIRSCDQ